MPFSGIEDRSHLQLGTSAALGIEKRTACFGRAPPRSWRCAKVDRCGGDCSEVDEWRSNEWHRCSCVNWRRRSHQPSRIRTGCATMLRTNEVPSTCRVTAIVLIVAMLFILHCFGGGKMRHDTGLMTSSRKTTMW